MGTKQVSQCSCDRCKRVWYEDPEQVKRQQSEVDLTASIGDEVFEVSFDCLCEGCAATVKGLLQAITRVMDKASPIRGAKKKAVASSTGEIPAPDTTAVVTPAVPVKAAAAAQVTPAPLSAQAHAGVHVSVASGAKSSSPAPSPTSQQARPASDKS